jgi:hypothetical protein
VGELRDNAAGARLIAGRYAMLGELGRGGMGVVWRAEDRVIGRHVAVKELRLPGGIPAAERSVLEQRVLREARSAGRLNDPGVVTVYDVVVERGTTYIVMELVSGPTLAEVVRRDGPLPAPTVSALARQVLAALDCAHAAGIVHRDVKPSNIMVLPDGRVKLADFGIAQAMDDPRVTTSGTIVGSPAFMAPERISGGEATPASDLWSLGVTLFFAVQGWIPFERPTTAATLHAVLHETPPPVRCPEPLAAVITGLLIGAPEARLTAPQVRALLARAGEPADIPVTGPVRPLTAVYPGATRPVRRRGALAVAAAVGALALFAAGALTSRFLGWGGDEPIGMTPTLSYGPAGAVPDFQLSKGSCANGRVEQGRRFPSSAGVSCAEPHDIEVFAADSVTDYADPAGYPGLDPLARYAERRCALLFGSDRVTAPDKNTALEWVALVPSAKAWAGDGDGDSGSGSGARRGYCVLWRIDGAQLQRSVLAHSS